MYSDDHAENHHLNLQKLHGALQRPIATAEGSEG